MTETVAQSAKSTNVASSTPDTMEWDSRARRVVMIYLPLSCFVLILLFPFYWMAITSFKPNGELLNYKEHNPFWISSPTLAHIKHLLFNTAYPSGLIHSDDSQIGRSSSNSVDESRNCRQRHAGRSPSA
jgi:multiple sugar transport system permease protein